MQSRKLTRRVLPRLLLAQGVCLQTPLPFRLFLVHVKNPLTAIWPTKAHKRDQYLKLQACAAGQRTAIAGLTACSSRQWRARKCPFPSICTTERAGMPRSHASPPILRLGLILLHPTLNLRISPHQFPQLFLRASAEKGIKALCPRPPGFSCSVSPCKRVEGLSSRLLLLTHHRLALNALSVSLSVSLEYSFYSKRTHSVISFRKRTHCCFRITHRGACAHTHIHTPLMFVYLRTGLIVEGLIIVGGPATEFTHTCHLTVGDVITSVDGYSIVGHSIV